MEQINIKIMQEKGRIDKVLTDLLRNHTRSQIQQWLKNRNVIVNGEITRANYKVKENDEINIYVPEAEMVETQGENIPITIVYEDESLLVINKPQGMVVHPSVGHTKGTLVNALLYHIKDLSSINGVIRPGIVHRIDKDTSGLLMVAKNDQAHIHLAEQLKDKTSLRKYIALVHGEISHEKGEINAPIGRSKNDRKMQAVIEGGKSAITHFKVLERFAGYTLVQLQLETGRTHQIRVHMKYIGYPLTGDPLYGPKKTLKGKGQFLHAEMLGFKHPATDQMMIFEAPLPELFEKTLADLRNNH